MFICEERRTRRIVDDNTGTSFASFLLMLGGNSLCPSLAYRSLAVFGSGMSCLAKNLRILLDVWHRRVARSYRVTMGVPKWT
jgi:hypothetical protein